MFFNYLIKKPILPIALLITYIFLHNLAKQGKLDFFLKKEGVIPTSCRAVAVKLNRRIPKDWKSICVKNNLHVEFELDDQKINPKNAPANLDAKKTYFYRELANAYVLIAKNSPDDTLERTAIVRVTIKTPEFKIESVSYGRDVVKLAGMEDKKMITIHLQKTIRTKEFNTDAKIPDFPLPPTKERKKKFF